MSNKPMFTPGPWEVSGTGTRIYVSEIEETDNVRYRPRLELATLLIDNRANAHIIAAAPELYDACMRVLAEYRHGLTIGCIEDLVRACAKAEVKEED